MNFDYESRIIFSCVHGSKAYGTSTPESDTDVRGVIVAPATYYMGLDRFEQYEPEGEDTVYFDIRKFVNLAMKGNPNIIEQFFIPPELHIVCTPYGKRLLQLRQEIVTKAIVKPHIGMVTAHLKRLDAPYRKCGEKGKAAIEKYGYNTKDACHIVRVITQCEELLRLGYMTLPSPMRKALMDIKQGKWTLEQVKNFAEAKLETIRVFEKIADLPDQPNHKLINQVVTEIVVDYLHDTDGLWEY